MRTIGIIIERQRTYGRRLCEGIVRFARERKDWSLRIVEFSEILDSTRRRLHDGFIARVMNDEIADILASTGKPVVDVFLEKPVPGFAGVDQNASLVGQMAARHFIERRALPLEDCGIAGVPALGLSRYRAVSPHLPEHIHPGCVEFNYCINGSLRLKKDKVRFTQLFKQVTGLPPHAFLLKAKVMRAKKLLAETDASVSEIAQRLALSSPRHFATLFRETLGITPTAYRLGHAATPRTFGGSHRTENTLPENRLPIVDTMFSS